MAKITISDLQFTNDTQSIHELSDWEMKTIEGGIISRRRRPVPNRPVGTTDSSDTIDSTLNQIDVLFSNLRGQIDETVYNLRNDLSNI